MGGGGGTKWRPQPSYPLPSGRFRIWVSVGSLKVADSGKPPTWARRPKLAYAPRRVVMWLVQIRSTSANSQPTVFARNFFNKIDAEASYLSVASVKNHLTLRGGPWNQICRLVFSELEVVKACGEGGNSLSQRHFIPEATSPVRVVIKSKNKANHSSSSWTVSPCCFPTENAAADCLHI